MCIQLYIYTYTHTHAAQKKAGTDKEHLPSRSKMTQSRTGSRCNTLQHTATHYNTVQPASLYNTNFILVHSGTHCTCCIILPHTAIRCNILQHTATYCITVQHPSTHCNTNTATHCNTNTAHALQHGNEQCVCLCARLCVRACFLCVWGRESNKGASVCTCVCLRALYTHM